MVHGHVMVLPILESAVTSAMHIAEILGTPLPFVGLKPKVEVAPELDLLKLEKQSSSSSFSIYPS